MSHQNFGDESNYKHEPKADHIVKDKFGKGTNTRNWKKNLDEKLEDSEDPDNLSDTDQSSARGDSLQDQ
jgi:DnaK suppressor protein